MRSRPRVVQKAIPRTAVATTQFTKPRVTGVRNISPRILVSAEMSAVGERRQA